MDYAKLELIRSLAPEDDGVWCTDSDSVQKKMSVKSPSWNLTVEHLHVSAAKHSTDGSRCTLCSLANTFQKIADKRRYYALLPN